MKMRILTGLWLLGIGFATTYWGGVWMWAWIALVSLVMAHEMMAMQHMRFSKTYQIIGYLCVGVVMISTRYPVTTGYWKSPIALLIAGVVVGSCIIEVLTKTVFFSKKPFWAMTRIVVFIASTIPYIYLLRAGEKGFLYVAFCCGIIWTSDSFAYFGGRFFGKTPLTSISPKKTVEGSIFGFLSSLILAVYLCYICAFPWIHFLVIAGIISILSMVGDLHESLTKRHFHIKDSSNFLPGHGGFYDRADSTLLVFPLAYFYFLYL